MKKIIEYVKNNILFLETIFLVAFIPLYPKLPILDIRNTWVYIRAEDFIVFFVIISWLYLFFKKKISLKTPLTIPILIYWIIGAISTLHGILIIFPSLQGVYPNVAFLAYVRHLEYLSLFFIAFHGTTDKKQVKYLTSVLVLTLLGIILYGFGQKFLGFPAFLTMNEEFAKGTPITLSALSRVPSTFAGHYDLAGYLVLLIPIVFSLFFGIKNYFIKVFLLGLTFLGFVLMIMTVSRVSFFVLFIGLLFVIFFQKRKLLLFIIPLGLILGIVLISTKSSSLLDRFKSTVSEVDVVVDAESGEDLGHVKFVPREYFKDKIVLQQRARTKQELSVALSEDANGLNNSTTSAILPYKLIPAEAGLVTAVNLSTGESLTQGTGYTNLYLSPVTRKIGLFFYELPPDEESATTSSQVIVFRGEYLVKRASAYDLSFTTRFQGEWPRAIEAFNKNLLIGSGYGSVGLAMDNNYLRMLAETGVIGLISFILLFLCLGIYLRKIFPNIDDPLTKSFLIGFISGLIGLFLNATLIDVFEASKIAFTVWALVGVTFGILVLYKNGHISLLREVKNVAYSNWAIIIYLFVLCFILIFPMVDNYFVGDDFTWLRWAADCTSNCDPVSRITSYFTNSEGFFYRPGTKLYFYLMYSSFWLNQVIYHFVSLILHFVVVSLLFLLALKVFKNKLMAFGSAVLFLLMSGSTEAIFWISSTGYLFNAAFGILGVLLFISWEEKKNKLLLLFSILSLLIAPMFHELGIVFPIVIVLYGLMYGRLKAFKNVKNRLDYLLIFIPVVIYAVLRLTSKSHWLSGDYNYDIIMLPFNFIGNLIGYGLLTALGPMGQPIYDISRNLLRENLIIALVVCVIPIVLSLLIYRNKKINIEVENRNLVIFGFGFFFITLLPFLGLGNITSRYDYLASFGLIIIFLVLIRKIYEFLIPNGREIAIGTISVLVFIFSLFHVIQIQQSYFYWGEAGDKTKNFFISTQSLYQNIWAGEDTEFNFVNVPIKVGSAWVFPVGLKDALWFSFRNSEAEVNTFSDTKSAVESAGYYLSHPVMEFQEDGSVKEIYRFENVPQNLIMP